MFSSQDGHVKSPISNIDIVITAFFFSCRLQVMLAAVGSLMMHNSTETEDHSYVPEDVTLGINEAGW